MDSLKMTSLENEYFLWRSRIRQPILFSSYLTNIASNCLGPPLVRSSGGMIEKH
jgi:hypothetical protein